MTDAPYRPRQGNYHYIDEETGHCIIERKRQKPEVGTVTNEIDATLIFQDAPRKTTSLPLLKTQYELQQDGVEFDNPAAPADKATAAAYNQWVKAQEGGDE